MRDAQDRPTGPLRPGDLIWITWSEIQRQVGQLGASLAAFGGFPTDRGPKTTAPGNPLMAGSACEREEPSFRIGYLRPEIQRRANRLLESKALAESLTAVELLVRHGIRGHRNFRDTAGVPIPFRFARPEGPLMPIASETFETYAFSEIAPDLALIVQIHNSRVLLDWVIGQRKGAPSPWPMNP